jgi:hypothetical protein
MALVTRQLRRLIIAKGECLKRKSNPLHPAVEYFNEERDRYIEEHGLARYLSEMLAEESTTPLRRCVVAWADGRLIMGHLQEDRDMALQDWIKRKWAGDLPYCVEVMRLEKVVSKYL